MTGLSVFSFFGKAMDHKQLSGEEVKTIKRGVNHDSKNVDVLPSLVIKEYPLAALNCEIRTHIIGMGTKENIFVEDASIYYVMEIVDTKEILAICGITPIDESWNNDLTYLKNAMWINFLIVKSTHHRKGIGKYFISYVLSRLQPPLALLSVEPHNERNIAFWQAMGFCAVKGGSLVSEPNLYVYGIKNPCLKLSK